MEDDQPIDIEQEQICTEILFKDKTTVPDNLLYRYKIVETKYVVKHFNEYENSQVEFAKFNKRQNFEI